jgi:hypothetical protein
MLQNLLVKPVVKKFILYLFILLCCGIVAFTANKAKPYQTPGRQELLDSINHVLLQVTDYKPQFRIMDSTGIVSIYVEGEHYYRIVVSELGEYEYAGGKDIGGIEAIPCDRNLQTRNIPTASIQFNRRDGEMNAHLVLKCIDDDELYHLQRLLVLLLKGGSWASKFHR